jgi:hypothetical protein
MSFGIAFAAVNAKVPSPYPTGVVLGIAPLLTARADPDPDAKRRMVRA